jgi:membrane associated rhomboid family serine protease
VQLPSSQVQIYARGRVDATAVVRVGLNHRTLLSRLVSACYRQGHMDRLLARLERRLGGLAIPHLTAIIVAGMGAAFVGSRTRPELIGRLALDIDEVKHGQVWRLVTYLFIPRTDSWWWIIFSLGFLWWVGTTLERHWGAFRFNVFYLLGCVGTTVAAVLTGHAETNVWINYSLMLAFGTLFPDEEFYLYVIPVKAKWLALFDGAFLAYTMVMGDWSERAAILAALSGYFIFCGPALYALLKDRNIAVRQRARRASVASAPPAVAAGRVCAICGVSEEGGADIRVCSCAKCGGPRTLCLNHARAH